MAPLTTELSTPVTGTYQQPIGLFIGGKWVEGVDKKKFEVINPSTEEVITSICEGTEKDIDLAVAAARKAFEGDWKKTSPQQRGNYLLKLADLAEKNLDLLAAVESLDNGKSITNARGDVGAVVGCLRYYGGWADKIEGKTIDISPDMFHYTRSEPVSSSPKPPPGFSLIHVPALTLLPHRLVSAVRSSPGTSLFSCWHGRSALPWPPVTPLS